MRANKRLVTICHTFQGRAEHNVARICSFALLSGQTNLNCIRLNEVISLCKKINNEQIVVRFCEIIPRVIFELIESKNTHCAPLCIVIEGVGGKAARIGRVHKRRMDRFERRAWQQPTRQGHLRSFYQFAAACLFKIP